MEDYEVTNTVEAQLKIGAKIQKFYDIMEKYRVELQDWKTEDKNELTERDSKVELLYHLKDTYILIFQDIVVRIS